MSPRLAQSEDLRCRALWRAVLWLAYSDLVRKELGRGWFDTPDCLTVCEFADVDVKKVRRAADRVLIAGKLPEVDK